MSRLEISLPLESIKKCGALSFTNLLPAPTEALPAATQLDCSTLFDALQLRALARERQSLKRQGARLKTQRHAYDHGYQPDARTLDPPGGPPETA
jgi:hypothetical protein